MRVGWPRIFGTNISAVNLGLGYRLGFLLKRAVV